MNHTHTYTHETPSLFIYFGCPCCAMISTYPVLFFFSPLVVPPALGTGGPPSKSSKPPLPAATAGVERPEGGPADDTDIAGGGGRPAALFPGDSDCAVAGPLDIDMGIDGILVLCANADGGFVAGGGAGPPPMPLALLDGGPVRGGGGVAFALAVAEPGSFLLTHFLSSLS